MIIVILCIITIIIICKWTFDNNKFKLNNFVEEFVSKQNIFENENFLNFFKKDTPRTSNKTITYKNKKWVVQQADSAIMLDELITRINKLIDYIQEHPGDFYLKKLKHWDSSFVLENIKESWKNQSTSYSINKGDELVFCIRDKLNNSIHDINTLMFVAIHELAHIVTDELQHTDKFWNNMKTLLKIAESMNLYVYVDYTMNPVEYCGMVIDSMP